MPTHGLFLFLFELRIFMSIIRVKNQSQVSNNTVSVMRIDQVQGDHSTSVAKQIENAQQLTNQSTHYNVCILYTYNIRVKTQLWSLCWDAKSQLIVLIFRFWSYLIPRERERESSEVHGRTRSNCSPSYKPAQPKLIQLFGFLGLIVPEF